MTPTAAAAAASNTSILTDAQRASRSGIKHPVQAIPHSDTYIYIYIYICMCVYIYIYRLITPNPPPEMNNWVSIEYKTIQHI